LLLLQPADVEPKVEAPKGPPPRIVTVTSNKDTLVARITVTEMVPVQVREKIIVGGKEVERNVLKYITAMKVVEQTMNLKGAKAQQADGTTIEMASLKKRLAVPTTVVISADGQPVDPGYLRLFQKNTIIIMLAPGTGVGPGVPLPGSTPPVPKRRP